MDDQHLEKSELLLQLQRSQRDLMVINKVSAALSKSLDLMSLKELMQRILALLDDTFEFKHSMLLIPDASNVELQVFACHGYDTTDEMGTVAFGDGIIGVVAKRKKFMRLGGIVRKMAYINQTTSHETQKKKLPGIPDVNSQIAFPLLMDEQLIAVIAVESPQLNFFSKSDEGTLAVISQQIAVAVQNAMLYEQLEDKVNERTLQLQEANEELHQINEEVMAQRDLIQAEREKSDILLLNILPLKTAKELKEHGFATPKHYEMVSILFTDFKGFTELASRMSPSAVIEELNYCYMAFDDICARNNVEKIKTIGDAYMAAAGIPEANTANPVDIVNCALEIQDFMRNLRQRKLAKNQPLWEIRMGIHTGELIAGVVGKNKFAYDIWGDAVNIASRMESSGEVGKINISGYTHQLLQSNHSTPAHWKFEYRGEIHAKNKGLIDMYFVTAN